MISKISQEDYIEFWKRHSGNPLQSWSWGEVKKGDWEIVRLGFYDNNLLKGIVSIQVKKAPKIGQVLGLKKIGYIPRGLVCEIAELKNFLIELSSERKSLNIDILALDPDLNFSDQNWNEKYLQALKSSNWKNAGLSIQPQQTDCINLINLDEDIFSSFKPKWRRNIRKSIREKVSVKKIENADGILEFYKILHSSSKSKFSIHSENYFRKIWEELSKENIIDLFIGYFKGKPVSAYLLFNSFPNVYEIYGGVNSVGRDKEASYLMKYEMIKYYKEKNFKFYDQWGVSPNNSQNHPLSNVSYFKSGFGGEYFKFLNQYINCNNRLLTSIYKLFRQYNSY